MTAGTVQVATGTVVSTVEGPVESGGYHFTHWTLNGLRYTDVLGRSMNPAVFRLTEPTTAVAKYLVSTNATIGDSISDWYRWEFYGGTNAAANLDSDGDGFTLLEEYTRDTHPRLRDTMQEGGVSARASGPVLMIFATNYMYYTLASSPPGLTNLQQAVQVGTQLTLADLSPTQGEYQFAQWLVNGQRIEDALGRSIGTLTVTIASNTTVTAQYLSLTQDGNANGVPDWFEWQFLGSTNQAAAADHDGDGFSLIEEYVRDTHPRIRDTMQDGGVSIRASASVAVYNPNFATYVVASSPLGLIDQQSVLLTNTVIALPDLQGQSGGYQFAQWIVNSNRVADVLGRSVGNIGFILGSNTTATAQFLSATTDADGDGVPDWFELQFYGDTNQLSTADTDGDNFTLAEEYQRDYHPNLRDTIQDGGVSTRASGSTFVDLRPYFYYRIQSSPTGFVDQTGFVPVNTVIDTPTMPAQTNGYVFGHWELNGVRQQGAGINPPRQVTFELAVNVFATAVYHLPNTDSDGDGLPDWWEDYYLGSPTAGQASADPDGDGWNNLGEYRAGTDPFSATSKLQLSVKGWTAQGFTVRFLSLSNKVYQLHSSESLVDSNSWQVSVDNIQGTGGLIELIDTSTGTVTQRFYRIKVK